MSDFLMSEDEEGSMVLGGSLDHALIKVSNEQLLVVPATSALDGPSQPLTLAQSAV